MEGSEGTGAQGQGASTDPAGTDVAPSQPTTQPEPTDQGTSPPPEGGENYSLLQEDFWNEVPEGLRPHVETVVKKWDSQVGKKFAELHSKLKPYEELGVDHETAGLAVGLLGYMQSNPLEAYQLLHQRGLREGWLNPEQGQQQTQQAPPPQAPQVPPTYPQSEELPDWFSPLWQQQQEQLKQMDEVLRALATHTVATRQQQDEAENQKQVDGLLTSLHEKHGEFDNDSVMLYMTQGLDPDKAVEKYLGTVRSLAEKLVQSANPGNIPPPFTNGNIPPPPPVNLGALDNKAVKDLVQSVLAANNKG